jgi:hypothetical protein
MKSKKLILNEEVIRILEMMNIESKKSKLLTESIVDDIAQGIIRLSVKSGDDVATSLSKIEREFGVPKGTLNSGDIAKLSTKSGASDVVIKIVDNLSPNQLKIFTEKVWTQLPEAQTAAKDVIDNLVTSKSTFTSDNLLKYLNDKSEIAITSPVKELNPLIKSLRKEFVDRSYESVKGKGVIDNVVGSAGKVSDSGSSSIDDMVAKIEESLSSGGRIPDDIDNTSLMSEVSKIMNEFKIKKPSGIANETLKQEITSQIQSQLSRYSASIDEAEQTFLKLSPSTKAETIKTAISKIDNAVGKSNNKFLSKSWAKAKGELGTPRMMWEWYKYAMSVSLVYYIGIDCGKEVLDTDVSSGKNVGGTIKTCVGNLVKSAFWLVSVPRDIYGAVFDDESSEMSNVGTYTNDAQGFEGFSKKNGWEYKTDAIWDVTTKSGWHDLKNGTWQEYTFSGNTFVAGKIE